MKKIGLKQLATAEISKDFEKLLSLGKDQLATIAKHLNDEDGFGPGSEADMKALIGEVGIPTEDLLSVVRVSNFIYEQAEKYEVGIDDLLKELKEYAAEKELTEFFDEKKNELRALFQISPEYLRKKHVGTYKEACLRRLIGVTAVHDLRPVFNEEKNSIQTFLPLLILRFRTKTQEQEEEEFVFQVDEETVDKLIVWFTEYKQQFGQIRQKMNEAKLKLEVSEGSEPTSDKIPKEDK